MLTTIDLFFLITNLEFFILSSHTRLSLGCQTCPFVQYKYIYIYSSLLTCNLNLFNIRQALNPFTAETVPGEVYAVLFAQIRDVLLRLGGPPIRIKIARIEQELISLEMQSHYIQVLQNDI